MLCFQHIELTEVSRIWIDLQSHSR